LESSRMDSSEKPVVPPPVNSRKARKAKNTDQQMLFAVGDAE